MLEDILALARDRGVTVEQVPADDLDRNAAGLVHQGVVATAPVFPYGELHDVLVGTARRHEPPLLVALDGITDPHNVGSIARTAEAVGAHALLLPSRRSAAVTPTVEKAAAGALAHLTVVRIGNLVRTLGDLRDAGVWSVGLDADGGTELSTSRLLADPLVLVVGAEGRGLSRLALETCDEVARLPMVGQVGSLNASVAAAVALYEVLRQRRAAR